MCRAAALVAAVSGLLASLSLVACDGSAAKPPGAAADGVAGPAVAAAPIGERPPQAFLDERLILPNPGGYQRPDITVGQVEAYYAGGHNGLQWRKVDSGFALEISSVDELTGKRGRTTLLFAQTRVPAEYTKGDAVEADEQFAEIARALNGEEELDFSDIAVIAHRVKGAHLPVPSAILARRQVLIPRCDGQPAIDALSSYVSNFRDPFTAQQPTITGLSATREDAFDALAGARSCSGTAHMSIGDRLIQWQFLVRSGQLRVQGQQVENQPRPAPVEDLPPPARPAQADPRTSQPGEKSSF